MSLLIIALQLVIAFGLFNVWVLRFDKATAYRGGNATNMVEEFAVYGLPDSIRKLVGTLKLAGAGLLVLGVWVPALARYAAMMIAFLMLVAVLMHFRVADPLRKAVPAFIMLVLSTIVAAAR